MKNVIFYCLIFVTTLSSVKAKISSIYDTRGSSFISYSRLLNELPSDVNIILGEYHNTESIQNAQADFIRNFVNQNGLENNFTVAWEFLDFADQNLIKENIEKYYWNEISKEEMLTNIMGESAEGNQEYLPIFESVKDLNGQFIGINARRSIKKDIVRNGIDSIDQSLIPPNMQIGGVNYFERFEISSRSMGRPPHLTYPMFVAQSYTDSVMSYSLSEFSMFNTRFIIVGCFHSDYHDGFSKQLQELSLLPTVTIKIVNINQITREEMDQMLTDHPIYGPIADYIFFVE